ncbi:MAG TPA: ABC transporter permease [Acidobacteriaceae bacterium]|nr:ABC transporter permease [Acidobacteriaceae bacterium]
MRGLEKFRMAMLMLFRRKAETARLSDELQFHLDQQIKENLARGMSAEEARYAALRAFGNPSVLREEARSNWSWNWMEKFLRDLRYGVRTLMRSPGFALTAILVMALGIGATTSLFTIVRAVLLKPLPFRDPNHLVMVYEHFRADNGGDGMNPVSPGDFNDWRKQTHGFEDMAAWHEDDFDLTGEHEELPEVVQGAAGSWNLFSLLGAPMALGRAFLPEEDQVGANHVVVLTWNLFERRFGGDPSIIGRQIRLDTTPYLVVGVLPRWFTYPEARVQLWVPYASTFTPETILKHDMHQSRVVARVKPGVSAAAAAKEVGALQYQLHLANASAPVAEDVRIRPILDDMVKDVKTPLTVLLCAVGCMLLIACLNVSNLLVARSATKRKELSVRGALGGSRLTLIAEQMTESLLICVAGGTLGIMLSLGATQWLATHWQALPRAEAIRLDGTVALFAVGLVFVTALLAGLLPAISSTGSGILTGLQESSRSIGGSASRATLRKVLLTAEIALTVVLLVSAGLLFKSFLHLRTSNLGCATDHVLTMKYGLPEKQYDTPEKVIAFHEGILERVRRLPGVVAAGLVSTPPGGGYENDYVFTLPEHPSTSFQLQDDAMTRSVDPGYFSAIQIPLIRGRFFTNQERLDHYRYTVISKMFADKFFPNEDPIGKHVTIGLTNTTYEIIGVVGDVPWNVAQPIRSTMYFPILSGKATMATIVVRTAGDPLLLAVPVQQQVAALDPALPVSDVLTMEQIVGKSTATQSFSASLILAFAILSLLLAAIGLYGVLSYLVTQRITEIGIRVALGAQRGEVLRLVLMDGLGPVLVGLVIGIAGGATAANLIRSILYGTKPLDVGVFVIMTGTLLLTALLACALPALRASRIEPMQALRIE